MTSSKLALFYVCLLLSSQFSDSFNAPLNTTHRDSYLDITDVSTELSVTTADTADTADVFTAAGVVYKYVISPLAVFGICGNLMNLFVWSAESAFNPTTFFIKVLAVSGIALLGGYFLWYFLHPLIRDTLPLLYHGLSVYSRSVTVYATLAVVTTRWMAVYMPTRMKTLLTERRVIISCWLMLLWCLLAGLPYVIITTYFPHHFPIAYYVTTAVCMALPVVVLVCLNVSLVYKLCRRRSDSSLRQHNTTASVTHSSRFYRMLLAVVCLSVTTTIAYPVGFLLEALIAKTTDEQCDDACFFFLLAIKDLMEVFNTAVNVVFYLLFASQFRALLLKRFRCCRCHRRRTSDLAMRTTTTALEPADNS